jgi:SPRY domain-containing SOCS box protein 3
MQKKQWKYLQLVDPFESGVFYILTRLLIISSSMMFGIGTKKARLHVNAFTNLLGEDNNGWGLSHKGLLWHGGVARNYTKRFKENQATKIGILFDGIAGTLTYYKDELCLGVAFRGLNEVRRIIDLKI